MDSHPSCIHVAFILEAKLVRGTKRIVWPAGALRAVRRARAASKRLALLGASIWIDRHETDHGLIPFDGAFGCPGLVILDFSQ